MFFRKKTDPEMEKIITTLRMDMSNNYKDAAQDDFRRLKKCFEERADKMPEKVKEIYRAQIAELETALKGYTHKDQPVHAAPKI